ncbi:MAG: hypothetical protein AB1742_09435 [bacterium]
METLALPSAGLVFTIVFCFLLRILPRAGVRYYGGDAFYHMFVADVIRKTGSRARSADYFLIGAVNDYPPVLHYFLALFPERFVDRYNMAFGPAFDALSAAAVYAFTRALTENESAALAAGAIYALTPELQYEAMSLTPRLLGTLMLNLHFASLVFYVQYQQAVFLAAAAVTGVIDFYTHRIQLPLLFLISAAFAIAAREPVIIAVTAAWTAAAFLVNRGLFVRTLKSYYIMTSDNVRNWREYGTEAMRARPGDAVERTGTPAREKPSGGFSLTGAARILAQKGAVYLKYNPYGLAALALIAFYREISGMIGTAAGLMFLWFLVSYVTFAVTERCGILGQKVGEGYRQYLDFGAFPCAAFVAAEGAALYNSSRMEWWALFAACALFAYPGLRTLTILRRTRSPAAVGEDLLEVLNALKEQPRGNVMCLPPGYSYAALYFSRQPVLEVVERSVPYRDRIREYYTGLKSPMEEFAGRFDISYVLVNHALNDVRVPGGWGETVAKRGPFQVIRVPVSGNRQGAGL